MHVEADKFLQRISALLRDRRKIVEIGSREVNGNIRRHFPFSRRYIGIDLLPGDGVDIVMDFTQWTTEEKFDTIVCCEVLEHATDVAGICSRAFDLLENGGVFIVTAAGVERDPHSGVDGGILREGEHYSGICHDDLCAACSCFANVLVESTGQDIRALAIK